MSFSRALEKVPQGGPKCANLKGTSAWQQLDGGGESFSCGQVVDVDGGLLAVSIEGVIRAHCFEASGDESGCEPSTAGAKFDGDRSRVMCGKMAHLLTLS